MFVILLILVAVYGCGSDGVSDNGVGYGCLLQLFLVQLTDNDIVKYLKLYCWNVCVKLPSNEQQKNILNINTF